MKETRKETGRNKRNGRREKKAQITSTCVYNKKDFTYPE
jgi:hypothetical protein